MFKSLKNRIKIAFRLSLSDWLLLFEAWGILLFAKLALYKLSYESLSKSTLPSVKKKNIEEISEFSNQLRQLIVWASYLHIVSMPCLPKSLTLHWMLRRRGIESQIKIGVNKKPQEIFAHAWVEVDGEAVGESEQVIAGFNQLESKEKSTELTGVK